MQGHRNTLAVYLVAGLMALTAVLFIAATAMERRGAHQAGVVEEKPAAAEGSEARESQEGVTATPEQKVAGIDLEAPWVLYAVIVVTVLLIASLILFGYPLFYLVIVVAITGVILDVRELVHQVAASRTALVALVAIVALTRAATVAVSVGALVKGSRRSA